MTEDKLYLDMNLANFLAQLGTEVRNGGQPQNVEIHNEVAVIPLSGIVQPENPEEPLMRITFAPDTNQEVVVALDLFSRLPTTVQERLKADEKFNPHTGFVLYNPITDRSELNPSDTVLVAADEIVRLGRKYPDSLQRLHLSGNGAISRNHLVVEFRTGNADLPPYLMFTETSKNTTSVGYTGEQPREKYPYPA